MNIIATNGCNVVPTEWEYKLDISRIDFYYLLSQIKLYGKIVYEYNPLRNFRLPYDIDIYGNRIGDVGFNEESILEAGSVIDLSTEKLNFSLNYPVTITCQSSYDGSVNLILNDNNNIPRLINSRFTVLPNNQYKIVDRIGNNDTNLYDENQFDSDTSLYKRVNTLPKLDFLGIDYNGNLRVGNYVFYFKFSDSDGNETDFVAESSIVTCHIGNINDPHSIRGGIGDENSYKSVKFILNNVDTAYDYVTVYYTRSTSDVNGIENATAVKINRKFLIKGESCNIVITGFEQHENISIDDINTQYFIANRAKSQAACQNILFFGGVSKPDILYQDLADISLRMLPYYTANDSSKLIGNVNEEYIDNSVSDTPYEYYNVKNIYNHIGYWNKELYRLGVVYIMPDNTLSPVFNIRGRNNIPSSAERLVYTEDSPESSEFGYQHFDVLSGKDRVKIPIDESNGAIGKGELENSNGVIRIQDETSTGHVVYSINVGIPHEVLDYLKGKVRGLFFVRQKRTPTILAEALTLGFDKTSGIPLIPSSRLYISEGFLNKQGTLTNNYDERLLKSNKDSANFLVGAAICPEYNLRQPYFNNLFTSTEFELKYSLLQPVNSDSGLDTYSWNNRSYCVKSYINKSNTQIYSVLISAIGDDTPIISDSYNKFRARVGEAEAAWKFMSVSKDTKEPNYGIDANSLVRGVFGPYLGISKFSGGEACKLIEIFIPGYADYNITQYFNSRYEDVSSYYSITDRYSIEELLELSAKQLVNRTTRNVSTDGVYRFLNGVYRGDCFICNYTHRLNRNFQDPEAPNNDEIVDPNTFRDNYTKGDSEKNAKINRGDVNAVQLGSWITFKVHSNVNLSMRNWDDGYVSENGLTGTNRSFYPLSSMSTEGNTKIPESFVINTGESSTTSDKYNFILPDVPYIKNEFGTRIVYSDVAVNDAFKNGFRVFQANHYRDYPMIYGGIMKLIELYGNLLCVFEHGVALIPVNERAVAGEGAGGNVYINTSNVLPENPKMLSDMFGSQWPESVIKTPYYVYGVDTVAKKIWRTNGQQFEVISDFKIQKFLNDNITLTERELTPIIGVRNVKTHYNAFKGDVMFTFYDNLYGFEEKAWNICYNEVLQKWVTMYSWIPSFSENIDNIFFSFNRKTSKIITKLGTSKLGSTNADGIVLSDVVLKDPATDKLAFALVNRALPNNVNTGIKKVHFNYKLVDDNFKNKEYFRIETDSRLVSDTNDQGQYLQFKYDSNDPDKFKSKDVWLLNVQVEISILDYDPIDTNIKNYVDGWNEYLETNYGYYQSVIAITADDVISNPMLTDEEKNSPNLSTDFWKHGKSGIIDIKESIRPCYWYGEQHPFEFEFVVVDKPANHKIFNTLELISNKAQPESFHYEIVGEVYDWAHDKRNMYVRQESTKELYQNLGSDILYNRDYTSLRDGRWVVEKNPITNKYELHHYTDRGLTRNIKSTILPWYYERIDTFNDLYDCYQIATSRYARDYQNLSGTEIVWDEQLNEFRLLVHVKGNDFHEVGRLRGNMQYQEDIWKVEIPPIYFRQKNEVVDEFGNPLDTPDWNGKKYPPIILNNVPNDIKQDVITTKSLPKFNQ